MPSTKTKAVKAPHYLDHISPLIALALNGAKSTAPQRETIEAGIYDLDVTLHLTAEIRVGMDAPAKQVNKIEPWTIIALLLDKLPGVKIDDVVAEAEALLKIKEQEAAMEERTGLMKERAQTVLDLIKPAAAEAVDALKDATVAKRKGAVKLMNPTVEVLAETIVVSDAKDDGSDPEEE